MIINGPIAMLEAGRSGDPLARLIAAGEKLSNLAYQAGSNGGVVPRDHWTAAYEEWDRCASAYVDSQKPKRKPKKPRRMR
jgi:hypothetical protein